MNKREEKLKRPSMTSSTNAPPLARLRKTTQTPPKQEKTPQVKKETPPKVKQPHGMEYFLNKTKVAHEKMVQYAIGISEATVSSNSICAFEPIISSYCTRRVFLDENFDVNGERIEPVREPSTKPEWKRFWPKEGDSTFEFQRAKYDALKDTAYRSIVQIMTEEYNWEVIEIARKSVARFAAFRFIHNRQWTKDGKWTNWARLHATNDPETTEQTT